MPDAPGLELIAQDLNAVHEGAVIETAHEHGSATLVISPESTTEVLTWLRDTPGQEYTFLSSLHAADYLPAKPRFAVHYELLAMARVERIHVKALLDDPGVEGTASPSTRTSSASPPGVRGEGANGLATLSLPELDSCTLLFPTAEFQEREVYDMFGISFRGHPDLRRILMPEDYVGWPQRRDFPMGGEPVLFTHNEIETPGWWE